MVLGRDVTFRGTGIVATLLFDLPWASTHPAFRGIAAGFLILGILLFMAFASMTILRYTLYPRIFRVMIQHETHSLFLGCIRHEYGLATLDACLVLWWIALAMSILTSFGVPYVMFTKHNHTAEALTAAWLLPIVPTITVAASATVHCKLLLLEDRLDYCLVLFVASYILNGVGLLLASGIMVLYFQRLTLHHLPPREGRVAVQLFPKLAQHKPELAGLGLPMLGAGVVSGLMLWGLGIWFAFLAIVSIATQFTRGSSEMATLAAFNMGWWAFTFPLGSLTLLTFSLAEVFNSMFFKVISTILTLTVFCLWIVVFIPTAVGFLRGTLFPAPCLQALPKEYVERVGTSEKSRAAKGVTAEEKEREEVARTAGVA
ncbi:SPOSA6832_00133 [Sporobolomyces salmonicolor]|uniref:SPOSA6832_00133-mRNA-1:cds n=1 Tax=Sporidiobolus salmonicolor TaxID=5005 RepID=A0A0D6EFC8_SPOSA|nr:SPOSA6832_00133 [Sporobolomyces salmonicolor]